MWGTGGDLGITRDGAHAEEIVLPASGVSRRPASLTPEQAASAGVPFITAWTCLVDAAALRSGETVIVSGAAGAVGWAAVELAAALGGRVIALVQGRRGGCAGGSDPRGRSRSLRRERSPGGGPGGDGEDGGPTWR